MLRPCSTWIGFMNVGEGTFKKRRGMTRVYIWKVEII